MGFKQAQPKPYQATESSPTSTRSPSSSPTSKSPNEHPPNSIVAALSGSCAQARLIEQTLFKADSCSSAGLLVAQLRLLFARLERGIAASRTDLLSILAAANRLSRERR
jgi:hypothetical protein